MLTTDSNPALPAGMTAAEAGSHLSFAAWLLKHSRRMNDPARARYAALLIELARSFETAADQDVALGQRFYAEGLLDEIEATVADLVRLARPEARDDAESAQRRIGSTSTALALHVFGANGR